MALKRACYGIYLVCLLVTGSLVVGPHARRLKRAQTRDDGHKELWSMLPRGIVPPSGPSPCHNILERKRTHPAPPLVPPLVPLFPPFAPPFPPFSPPFAPPFPPQFPFQVDPPPPPPQDDIICP
ncbi:hypothetical protein R6Q59_006650 [Mikania micrantha]